jgi:PEP-utilising enzyme, PEP-binding domain
VVVHRSRVRLLHSRWGLRQRRHADGGNRPVTTTDGVGLPDLPLDRGRHQRGGNHRRDQPRGPAIVDGFSIGSNDLTQLTLGVDRDSELLAHLFDERDPGVKKLIEMVTKAAHAAGRKVGLCGQAPSDHPEFAEFLADIGLDSISVTADALPAVVRRLGREKAR